MLYSIINKPEKNMWNDKNSETPTRAFYYTGGRTQESRENIYYFKPFC
ncbi:hypothetical protein HPCPY6311_0799 [Helicobacter pylori CPY6311]|nr:hypothetical protein HPCPY6311_0799 [Helicobacter pylori CPY6311]